MQKRILLTITIVAAMFAASPSKASVVIPSQQTPLTATIGHFSITLKTNAFPSGVYGGVEAFIIFGPAAQPKPNIIPAFPLGNAVINVFVKNKNGSYSNIGHFTTLSSGEYYVSLPPGTYYFAPADEFLSPENPGPIVVAKGKKTGYILDVFGGIL